MKPVTLLSLIVAFLAVSYYLSQMDPRVTKFVQSDVVAVSDVQDDRQAEQYPEAAAEPSGERVVAVVGGGLAGMSAALEAHRADPTLRILLIEKNSRLGGNSASASSGINGVGSAAQRKVQSKDTIDAFVDDTLRSGKGRCVPELVDRLVGDSAEAIAFLYGYGLPLDVLAQLGGHSHARTHRIAPMPGKQTTNVGFTITSTLREHIEEIEQISVITDAKVTELIQCGENNDQVVGVRYKHTVTGEVHHLSVGSVVLTTGGYAADRAGFLSQYVPHFAKLCTTNGPFALGEGVRLAQAVGAGVVDMDQVQVHPTSFVHPDRPTSQKNFLAPEALRGSGGILLDNAGQRFVDELSTRDVVSAKIFEHCKPLKLENGEEGPTVARLLLNEEAVGLFIAEAFAFYTKMGLIQEFNSVEELAVSMQIPTATLLDTFEKYEAAATEGVCEFGKTTFPAHFHPRVDQKLYSMMITPALHYTMGGILIDTNARVLTSSKDVIPGLFAAGEVTGGVHGANRLGGNSLLECVVFGRTAGREAVTRATTLSTTSKL